MRILIVHNRGIIPAKLYGGTQRVMWALGKELSKLGHEVSFLVNEGSYCDFGSIIPINPNKPVLTQIPDDFDFVHFFYIPKNAENLRIPYMITSEVNPREIEVPEFDKNTVFVSSNHAKRFNSDVFVYNGLDWDDYMTPDLKLKRTYFHFLGNASWRVKNVKGAIDVIKHTKAEKIKILGGVRFNIKSGIRLTFTPRASFMGMVGGKIKDQLINGSKGLIFPVRWAEPFGLAITESLYYGCPVFGTPYGSLPELVSSEFGFLSNKRDELVEAINNADAYSRRSCHEYARDVFNSQKMTAAYIKLYDKVLSGKKLNKSKPRLIVPLKQKFLDWT